MRNGSNTRITDLLEHLATRPGHDEVKADFRQLLTEEFGAEIGAIDFERRVPEVRGRIDALIGRTVFEAKSNLDREWGDVARRMPDYLADREREEGERFVGIASDGLKWAVFELRAGALEKLKETTLDPAKPDVFLAWLDGALALKSSLPPEALTIRMELGGDSVAFRRASEELLALWETLKDRPDAELKKQLWASMLKLVYGRDIDNDMLWIQHTYLVIVAKAIALAVLELVDDDPVRMLSGSAFEQANIRGAVESDFFDWAVATPDGEQLVRKIVSHVRRFRLREVESDVLKILYESLIDRDERHGLGEYYTPDWLARKVVRHSVTAPHEQKVLDPACGSGTFLFHAIRNFLTEAEEIDYPVPNRASEATRLVAGMDIHPVAVIIARVTYLLALSPVLGQRKGDITIPVYLGEAMQLSITRMLSDTELRVRVPPPKGEADIIQRNGHGGVHLDFPEAYCRHPEIFDHAIFAMRRASDEGWTRAQYETNVRSAAYKFFDGITDMDDRWEDPRTEE
ncbi:MAG: N-6 DNA methylase [Pseudomonadota bacterium]